MKKLLICKQFRENEFKTSHILLLLAIIILILPALLSLPAWIRYFDFSTSGQIGDTIGGITAPFINGLAAILVFFAFKAQIKANEILKKQEHARIIFEQIAMIQDDKLENESNIRTLIARIHELSVPEDKSIDRINKVIYFTTEIQLASELINKYTEEKDFLYRKLYYLYTIRYKHYFEQLENAINQATNEIHEEYNSYINELLLQIQKLNTNLADLHKYKSYRQEKTHTP